jgi:hypothetical protein
MDVKNSKLEEKPNNAHAHRPPMAYLLEVKGYLRRVIGNVSHLRSRFLIHTNSCGLSNLF